MGTKLRHLAGHSKRELWPEGPQRADQRVTEHHGSKTRSTAFTKTGRGPGPTWCSGLCAPSSWSGQGPMIHRPRVCRGAAPVHVSWARPRAGHRLPPWARPRAGHRLPPALSPDAAGHLHYKKAQTPRRSPQSSLSPAHQCVREQRRGRQEWGTAIPSRGEGDDVTVKTPARRV